MTSKSVFVHGKGIYKENFKTILAGKKKRLHLAKILIAF